VPLPVLTDKYLLKRLGLAGQYALDVAWGDGHGSIYPFRDLRARCPCDACRERPADVEEDARARTPVEIAQEGPNVRVLWEDDHPSVFPISYLRDICRCALCAGEQGPVDMYLGKK
jgi:DUF971 family protein